MQVDKNYVSQVFSKLEEAIPSPTTELEYTNFYTLLVAVVLSARATDKSVNKATKALFKIVQTPNDMCGLGIDKLTGFINTIGLYTQKAKHIISLSEQLLTLHSGEVPQTREALEALPGVGRKTANVILNTAFGVKTIAVDTHVFRVSKRLGFAKGNTPTAVELELMECVPVEYLKDAHHLLILHGRYTCTAIKPKCHTCILNKLCVFDNKTLEEF